MDWIGPRVRVASISCIRKRLVDCRDGCCQKQGGFVIPVVLKRLDLCLQFLIPLRLNFCVAPPLTALIKRDVSENQLHVRILFPERTCCRDEYKRDNACNELQGVPLLGR